MLARYEEVYPGFTDVLVREWREEGARRRQRADRLLDAGIRLAGRGQILAFVIALAGLAAATFLLQQGKSLTGLAVFVGSLGVIVTAFLWGRRSGDGGGSANDGSS
jgi:uncharacterized membrane protein